jgi:propionyl-CoA synthetase
VGFLVLKKGVDRDPHEIVAEVVQMVRQKIGPEAAFKTAVVVPPLPKTRSGKVLRGTIQKIADGNDYKMPATIDDSSALIGIENALIGVGYARKRGSTDEPRMTG